MKPQAPLCLLLLAVSAAARPGEPERPAPPPDQEPSLEKACEAGSVDITLLPSPPPDPGAPPSGPAAPPLELEAAAAVDLLGGRVAAKPGKDGVRELKWTRGDSTPERCVELLSVLGGHMPGRVRVTDPRYGKTRALVLTGAERAGTQVERVEASIPKEEPASAPGFFAKFFDGGSLQPAAPLSVPETGPSGNPYEGIVFSMAPIDAPKPKPPSWRDGTAFPSTFNRDSAPPPDPAGGASSQSWWGRTGQAAADFAGASWRTASEYWGRGAEWVKERLIRAPLAAYTRITSEFGSRFHPIKKRVRHHDGVDFAAAPGTAVYSAGDGVVASAGWQGGYGKAIVIRHPSGTETLYGHLSAIGVVNGQKVTMGRVIGQVGSTGQSTGPHLHYEVRRNGTPVDPLKVTSL